MILCLFQGRGGMTKNQTNLREQNHTVLTVTCINEGRNKRSILKISILSGVSAQLISFSISEVEKTLYP